MRTCFLVLVCRSYYIAQVIAANGGFHLFRAWGRTGTTIGGACAPCMRGGSLHVLLAVALAPFHVTWLARCVVVVVFSSVLD
jgi:hypothetical protein